MRWTDQAIILSAHKFGETGAVVKVFSRDQGICSGAVRGAYGKTRRGLYQPGNIVHAAWSARLADQLGNLHCEMEEPVAAFLMNDPGRLLAMSSALALTGLALAAHDPHPLLYEHLYYLIQRLKHALSWQQEYVQLELTILKESGFGLHLDTCAATGSQKNLIYVSPKSGQAVSAEAGEPYKDKLLRLPPFLQGAGCGAQGADIAQGLALTGYFLERRLLEAHHQKMPPARERLAGMLSKPSPKGRRLGEGEYQLAHHSMGIRHARRLRADQTDVEQRLWLALRDRRLAGSKFCRQQPVGSYIADFLCLESRLIVELDGSQHTENQEQDARRNACLQAQGFTVLRFWNNEILENFEGVLETIAHHLPQPSPSREREDFLSE